MRIHFSKRLSHTLFLHSLWISFGTLSTPLNKFQTSSAWIISFLKISNGNFQKQNSNFRLKWHLVGTYDRTPPKFEWKSLRGQRKRWEIYFSISLHTHTRKLCIYTYIGTDVCMSIYVLIYKYVYIYMYMHMPEYLCVCVLCVCVCVCMKREWW